MATKKMEPNELFGGAEDHFGESELSNLQKLVTKQLVLEVEVASLEEQLKAKKKELNVVSQEEIPNFLSNFGLSEVRLASGQKVIVKSDVSVSIKDHAGFIKFLQDRHDDAIVKQVMEVENPEDAFMDELIERGVVFSFERKIHAQTLKAYFREFLELGETPPDSVSLYTYSKTYIK